MKGSWQFSLTPTLSLRREREQACAPHHSRGVITSAAQPVASQPKQRGLVLIGSGFATEATSMCLLPALYSLLPTPRTR